MNILLSLFLFFLSGTLAEEIDCPYTTKPTFIGSRTNCSVFYECLKGELYEFSCPTGLLWDDESKYCDNSDDVTCNISPPTTVSTGTTIDPLCPSITEVYNVPHPYDCSKYYQCIAGYSHLRDCPMKMLFSVVIAVCDNEDRVHCTIRTTPNGPTNVPGSICTSLTGTYNVPDPDDCTKFYRCVNGEANPRSCPENLYFNADTNQCDYMDMVDCKVTGRPSSGTTSTKRPTSAAPTTSPVVPTSEDPLCPSSTSIYNVVYPYDCSKFYKCINGQSQLSSCPENMYFDPETLKCDYMDRVSCELTSSSSRPSSTSIATSSSKAPTTSPVVPTSEDPICPSSTSIYNIVYPYDCSKYYKCINGQSKLTSCPENMLFNPATLTCDYTDKVDCDSTSLSTGSTTKRPTTQPTSASPVTSAATTIDPRNICAGKPDGTYLADPTNCKKFYECFNGQASSFTCPKETVWDQEELSCVYSANDC